MNYLRFQQFCAFPPPSPGTLTQNEMVFRRLHLGTVAYGMDSMDEVQSHVFSAYTQVTLPGRLKIQQSFSEFQKRKGKTLGKNHQTIPVVRNTSVCDDCLVECFLTSDDILCPTPPLLRHQRPVKQETGLAHERSPDRTSLMTLPLTPGMRTLLKIARPQ